MQTNTILSAPLIDLIFDGRNKAYGAYELRKTYSRRIILALIITLLLVGVPIAATMSPPAAALEVSEALADVAGRHANGQKVEHRLVVRGAIVRDAIEGVPNEENARRNGVSPDTVRLWRFRAATAESTSQAFTDARRPGRPPQVAVETRAMLMQIACDRPLSHARLDARMGDLRTARDTGRRAAKRARARAGDQAEAGDACGSA